MDVFHVAGTTTRTDALLVSASVGRVWSLERVEVIPALGLRVGAGRLCSAGFANDRCFVLPRAEPGVSVRFVREALMVGGAVGVTVPPTDPLRGRAGDRPTLASTRHGQLEAPVRLTIEVGVAGRRKGSQPQRS